MIEDEDVVDVVDVVSTVILLSIMFVCLFVCGFVPYRQLELLAVEGLVPWVIICVCAGVT